MSSSNPNESINYRTMVNYDRHIPAPEASSDEFISAGDRILLLRLSAIGDAIRLLPAVEFLRNNGFEGPVDCVVQPPIQEFLDPYETINTVYRLPLGSPLENGSEILRLIGRLRQNDYDWVFDGHGLLKSGLLSFLTGADNRVGYARETSREGNYYFQTDPLSSPLPADMPRILKYIQLIRPFLADAEFNRSLITPDYPPLSSERTDLKQLADRNPVLVQPCTSHSRYGTRKEWGVDNLVTYLERLKPTVEAPIALTWGPGERPVAEEIADEFPGDDVTVAPETTVRELTYLIQNASIVVSMDTSVSHMADLLGIPLVVVFGGSSYPVNAPLLTDYRFVTRRSGEDHIEEIPVDRVLSATTDLLASLNDS